MLATTIALTGGPCAGKTTAQTWIEHELEHRGISCLFVTEAATEIFEMGSATRKTDSTNRQAAIMSLQCAKEDAAKRIAEGADEPVVVICDRGLADAFAYVTPEQMAVILGELGIEREEVNDRYDAVIHLTSAAVDAPEAYTTENNPQRTETVQEAALADRRTLEEWVGHPHLRVVSSRNGSFEEKMRRTVAEVVSAIGVGDPLECERKWLVNATPRWAEGQACHSVSRITQTYLTNAEPGSESRVRCRERDGHREYVRTTKTNTDDPARRIERERRISAREYADALKSADPSLVPIEKTRHTFVLNDTFMELDFYQDGKALPHGKAILEIECANPDAIVLPPELADGAVEVTGQKEFSNHAIARRLAEHSTHAHSKDEAHDAVAWYVNLFETTFGERDLMSQLADIDGPAREALLSHIRNAIAYEIDPQNNGEPPGQLIRDVSERFGADSAGRFELFLERDVMPILGESEAVR